MINKTRQWYDLMDHFEEMSNCRMQEMFDGDPSRFHKFSIKFNDILLDYSKNIINEKTLELLVNLAKEAHLKDWTEKMFAGEHINSTENRAVLHVALRNMSGNPMWTDNRDVMPQIIAVLAQMKNFVDEIHSGRWKGCTGQTITDVVNIGIGGSDLGPAMVCRALKFYSKTVSDPQSIGDQSLNVHFVSNVDPSHITETLKVLDPARTLFIIASKTFTTQETITNANSAKEWIMRTVARRENDIARHFIALSTNEQAVVQFGIDPKNMFAFWNWVGGRYSLWSAIGLSIALQIGMDGFNELLEGAYEMDLHFRTAPYNKNIPVLLALLGVWYNNFF